MFDCPTSIDHKSDLNDVLCILDLELLKFMFSKKARKIFSPGENIVNFSIDLTLCTHKA